MATVEAVDKTITLLERLAEHPRGIGVLDLAERCGIAPSTTHRYLASLQRRGLVEQDERKLYALTPRLYLLGLAAGEGLDLETQAQGTLQRLADATRETVCLMVRDGRHAVCIRQIDSDLPLKIAARVGSRQDLRVGATSRVLLAFAPEQARDEILAQPEIAPATPNTVTEPAAIRSLLANIRRDGHYVSRGELDEGVVAVAAPVYDRGKEVIAALVIAAPASRIDRQDALDRTVTLLTQEARRFSAHLGFATDARTPAAPPLPERTSA